MFLSAFAAFALGAPLSAHAVAKYNLTMTISGTIPVPGMVRPIATKAVRNNVPLPLNKKVFCASAKNFYTPKVGGAWRVKTCSYNAKTRTGKTTLIGTFASAGVTRTMNLTVNYKYRKVANKGGAVTTKVSHGASDLTIKVRGTFTLGTKQPFSSSVLRRQVSKPATRKAFCAAAQNFSGPAWKVRKCVYNVTKGVGTATHAGTLTTAGGVKVPVNFTAQYVYSRAMLRPVLTVKPLAKRNVLTWNPVKGARSYTVLRKAPGQKRLTIYRQIKKGTRFVDRKIKRKKFYTYAIIANGAKSNSLPSKPVKIKTI